jgi:putative redox protein
MATMILAAVTVEGDTGYAQKIHTASHELLADEPVRRGGTGTGPAPFELLLSSLGACTAITFRMYAERKQWTLGAVSIRLRLLKDGDEQHIERTIHIAGELDGEQRAKLLEIADKTPVTKVIVAGIPIQTTVDTGV